MTVQYTSEDSATLPSDNSELSHVLDAGELNDVAILDGVYASVNNTLGYAIFQFEKDATGLFSDTIYWSGKADIAPSSNPVYLQIYKVAAPAAWETIDSDSVTAAGADFVLTATVADLTNYKDGSGIIYCRVYQATSVGVSIVDSWTSAAYHQIFWLDAADAGGKCGQAFTGDGKTLDSIKIRAENYGALTGSAYIYIYAETHATTYGTDSVPTGAILATSDALDVSTLSVYPVLGDVTLTFSGANRITLDNGTEYVYVLDCAGVSGTKSIAVELDDSGADGNFSYWNGSDWVAFNYNDVDAYFIVYGV